MIDNSNLWFYHLSFHLNHNINIKKSGEVEDMKIKANENIMQKSSEVKLNDGIDKKK